MGDGEWRQVGHGRDEIIRRHKRDGGRSCKRFVFPIMPIRLVY